MMHGKLVATFLSCCQSRLKVNRYDMGERGRERGRGGGGGGGEGEGDYRCVCVCSSTCDVCMLYRLLNILGMH